jgi:GNAT superfamily N-acetyltransferase
VLADSFVTRGPDSRAVEIRQRREDDLGDLVDVAARVHQVDDYPMFLPDGDLVRFLTRPTPIVAWVAVRGARIVGHVALHDTTSRPVMELVEDRAPTSTAAYVARQLVDPSSRGRGVGRRLLEHARRAAVEKGRSPFLDVVDTPTAAAAISLYRHAGWEEIGRVRFELVGEEVDELVFRGSWA